MPAAAAGPGIVNILFDLCVRFLLWLAGLLGVSYQAINIWIFCILWPAFTLALIVVVIWQRRRIRALEQAIKDRLPAKIGEQAEQ
jgi:hypothetical protein